MPEILKLLYEVGTSRVVAYTALAVGGSWLASFLIQGVRVRRSFLKMKAQGIPIMEPYSMILGHLPLMSGLGKGLPSDLHRGQKNILIVKNWKQYFPNATECPPVIYLDAWPFVPMPFVMIINPDLAAQITQDTPQPRHSMFKWANTPLTGGMDLIGMDQADHKIWRARLNPGFSSRNLASHMPALVEEVSVFGDRLKSKAGDAGDWGDMLTLYDSCIALTFDVIMRIAIGLRIHEQTTGPGPILQSLRGLISFCKMDSLYNRLERLSPAVRSSIAHHTGVIRGILQPQVESRLHDSAKVDTQKTVVDMALKTIKDNKEEPSKDFIELVIANLKIFLFAGHDTTALTLCWVYYELNNHPEVLAAIREEHDRVLGPDPALAKQALTDSYHKLNELTYTTAAIKEALRLHPPAGTLRQATPDFVLTHNGVHYPTPQNAVVQLVHGIIHVHPDFWPQADEFKPERFLVSADDPLYPVKNAWRPFEQGPTRCIGEELAMMEMKMALVFTLRELDFDFNYEEWDKLQGRGADAAKNMMNGQRAYRAGEGMGHIKDHLPTRVRSRKA